MTGISPTRAFAVTLTRRHPLSPDLARLTFSGSDLHHFGAGGFDQRIKLMLPLPDGSIDPLGLLREPETPHPIWYPRWRDLPDSQRPPIRTYTVRHHRPVPNSHCPSNRDRGGELDIDFVLHADAGPAAAWATAAYPGDRAIIIGSNARANSPFGVVWKPGPARHVLLAGDETALPAISAILERLSPDVHGHALIEIAETADQIGLTTSSSVATTWLPRHGAPHGAPLSAAVQTWAHHHLPHRLIPRHSHAADPVPDRSLWDVPNEQPLGIGSDDWYLWLTGESGTITGLRRHLLAHTNIGRHQIAFMGYWRHGHAQA